MSYDIRLVSIKKKGLGLKNTYKIEEYHEDYTKNFIKNYLKDLTESRHLFVRKERVCVYYTYLRKLNTHKDYFGFCFAFTSEYIEDIKELFVVCEDLISKIVYQKELLKGILPLDIVQCNKFIDKQPELKRIEGWLNDLIEKRENFIIPFKPSNADYSKIKLSLNVSDEEILFAIKNYNNINYYVNDIAREHFLKRPNKKQKSSSELDKTVSELMKMIKEIAKNI